LEEGAIPSHRQVVRRTAIYELTGSLAAFAGYLIITDPPLLPVQYHTRWTQTVATHDLTAPDATMFAPEYGGCPVSEVIFVYENCAVFVHPGMHWPAQWPAMSIAEEYYMLQYMITFADVSRDLFTITPHFTNINRHLIEFVCGNKTVISTSYVDYQGSVKVQIRAPLSPFTLVEPTAADVANCRARYAQRLELAMMEENLEVVESNLSAGPAAPNTLSLPTVVELFDPRSSTRRGLNYQLQTILDSLMNPANVLYRWEGNPDFGRPMPWDPHYKLPATSRWLDADGLQQLKRMRPGVRNSFELVYRGPHRLGSRGTAPDNYEVFTLLPITEDQVFASYGRPDDGPQSMEDVNEDAAVPLDGAGAI
jgi:hypothetical protein